MPSFQNCDSVLRLMYPEFEALRLSEKSLFTNRHGVASREISFFRFIGVCGRVDLHQLKTHYCDKGSTNEIEMSTGPESNDNH